MAKRKHLKDLDAILRHWPYDPDETRVRVVKASDGRDVLQMRVELGVLQLETTSRPDGERPYGFETYLDYLLAEELHEENFEMTEEQCVEVDREFLQYYHRRVCWLELDDYRRAVEDADHTLTLMNFVKGHAPSVEWAFSHEQYRPFVLFHRTHAAARAALDQPTGAEVAIGEINKGLEQMEQFFDGEEQFEDLDFDSLEMVQQLREFRETLRDEYNVGQTLGEQLSDAISREEYELAAELRDKIRRRHNGV